MMGVGKSTIGRILSKKLNMKFADIDKIIEKRELTSIKDIFESRGERYFRKIEKKVTLKILKKENIVIALGGGAFINQSIRYVVLRNCVSFWLNMDVKNLSQRFNKTKNRPLLASGDLEENLREIYKKRIKFYKLANYNLRCNKLSKGEIVNKILDLYEN